MRNCIICGEQSMAYKVLGDMKISLCFLHIEQADGIYERPLIIRA